MKFKLSRVAELFTVSIFFLACSDETTSVQPVMNKVVAESNIHTTVTMELQGRIVFEDGTVYESWSKRTKFILPEKYSIIKVSYKQKNMDGIGLVKELGVPGQQIVDFTLFSGLAQISKGSYLSFSFAIYPYHPLYGNIVWDYGYLLTYSEDIYWDNPGLPNPTFRVSVSHYDIYNNIFWHYSSTNIPSSIYHSYVESDNMEISGPFDNGGGIALTVLFDAESMYYKVTKGKNKNNSLQALPSESLLGIRNIGARFLGIYSEQ